MHVSHNNASTKDFHYTRQLQTVIFLWSNEALPINYFLKKLFNYNNNLLKMIKA